MIRSRWLDLLVLVISANGLANVPCRAVPCRAVPCRAVPCRAASLGARGFQTKLATIAELKSAMSIVVEGGTWFTGLGKLLGADLAPVDRFIAALNKVLRKLAKGKSNKIIALDLGLTEPSVASHMTAILRELRISNRAQAIIAFQKSSDTKFGIQIWSYSISRKVSMTASYGVWPR